MIYSSTVLMKCLESLNWFIDQLEILKKVAIGISEFSKIKT